MAVRISHSLLDPMMAPLTPRLYRALRIPKRFPPEGIVGIGHLLAIGAGFGFAFSLSHWWGGLLAAACVLGNHLADMVDGTHARATGQCRNGGELLDHFVDPLSFSYWLIGLAVACGRLELGLIAVICIYATAVLTNIRAKLTGDFVLAAFGPTEFKALLILLGLALISLGAGVMAAETARLTLVWTLVGLNVIGVVQLVVNLGLGVRDVNARGGAPDTSEWKIASAPAPEGTSSQADERL